MILQHLSRDLPESLPTGIDARNRRFEGIARLYGEAALKAYRSSHVCVVGVGGVGSWVVEALARSAIGFMTLIDLDHVSESNTNRQIHALDGEYGKAKVESLKHRVAAINPDCAVQCIEDFATPDNVEDLLDPGFDFLVDCIDDYRAKAALIAACRGSNVATITVGGAGGKSDPLRIRVDDLVRSVQDPLLSRTRRLLRRQYRFPATGKLRVPCVFSTEQAVYPQADGGVGRSRPEALRHTLHCGGLGSATHVTASFGLAATSYLLGQLAGGVSAQV